MAHRVVLTERQRSAIFSLATDAPGLLRHYTLADDDLIHIQSRRRPRNRFGFALQLCAFRFPGRLLTSSEVIPREVVEFLAAQLGAKPEELLNYATREETRREHLIALRRIYGYRMFSGRYARDFKKWLSREAEDARSNEDIVRRFVARCRETQTILPAISTIERLCADALVDAERRIESRIARRIGGEMRKRMLALLTETMPGNISRLVWLRKFEVGNNSAAANRLLDRLEFLQGLNLPTAVLKDVPVHRITRLRRQGERYFTDGLRDITSDRRIAILACCCVEWEAGIVDAVIETHDRIIGKTWREAKQLHEARIGDARSVVTDTLRGFTALGTAMITARNDGMPIEAVLGRMPEWKQLDQLVATAAQLSATMADEPLAHVGMGYHRFRRYAPRMLRCLRMECTPAAKPLLTAALKIRDSIPPDTADPEFLRPSSKWRRHLKIQDSNDNRFWEVSVLFHLRDAFRSNDIWLVHSRRYGDMKQVLVPIAAAQQEMALLTMPLDPHAWLADRKARLAAGLKRLAAAARDGTIPHGSIENGTLRIDRLAADVPDGAHDLILDLYRRLPSARITDILLEVDAVTGFSEAFTHLRTGAPCEDRIGLLNVLLAEGLNLGLRKMAEASNTHDYWRLSRLARWYVEGEAMDQALATVVAAQGKLDMARHWGLGTTASSDGQFFPAARQGEAMNAINAKYGNNPGTKSYSSVNDQYAPFASRLIPVTASEAPYILSGLLANEAGKQIREQYADTAGYTDHVFGMSGLLDRRLVLRIRDLPSKRFYVFDPAATPTELRKLVAGKIREEAVVASWPDLFRAIATVNAGRIEPHQMLRKLAGYPRQSNLAIALREVGRIERTLFLIDWILDADMQRRAQIGLNKGEAHHALKNALRIGRQGEIRDRTSEGQHFRIAGLNLLAVIVIYWNTLHLHEAVEARRRDGLDVPPELLAHISPLGWAHILLTGEYRWPSDAEPV